MSIVKPQKPSFILGYWKPWKEESNLFDSWFDYARDTGLAKYSADTVGSYINQASIKQIQSIDKLQKIVGRGFDKLSNQISDFNTSINNGIDLLSGQLTDINEELSFLNRNTVMQLEQLKLSNLINENISELLRVPESEKERQHCIELGIKFFVNTNKDVDLYTDALEQFLKAESLMKQDYFVLHRIGCIYLHVEKYINPLKALDYFHRAAKYAAIESDKNAVRLANVLATKFNVSNSEQNNDIESIGWLASDSYENAAFAAYILGRFDDSVNYQIKALSLNSSTQNRFLLAKYQVRNGNVHEAVHNLDICITESAVYAIAVTRELDLINEPAVINLLIEKSNKVDNQIEALIKIWDNSDSLSAKDSKVALINLYKEPYDIKVSEYLNYFNRINLINEERNNIINKINGTIREYTKTKKYANVLNDLESLLIDLEQAKKLPYEKMQYTYSYILRELENESAKIRKAKKTIEEIDKLLNLCKSATFRTLTKNDTEVFIRDLSNAKELPSEKLISVYEKINSQISKDRIKVGDLYGGGIVFYVDYNTGQGLVCTKNSLGKAIWGVNSAVKFETTYDNGRVNTDLMIRFASVKSTFFSSEIKIKTAATLCSDCRIGGFDDWYLPSKFELKMLGMFNNDTIPGGWYWSSTRSLMGEAYAVPVLDNRFKKEGRELEAIIESEHMVIAIRKV